MSADPPDPIALTITAVEEVSSCIEGAFAQAGDRLGRGHAIFLELNQGLTAMSGELSGAEIEGASKAMHDIAERLNRLAQALPAESALLGRLGKAAVEASDLLKPLFKHIQMISIVARSARIEAASLAHDRENFLAFTQEAHDLAQVVKRSLDVCARDQDQLAKAIETALNRQNDFDRRYRDQLLSAGSDLISAYAGMQEQRGRSVQLTALAGSSTKRIAEAVGRSIISLQSGDSARQRLEHVCHGLRLAGGSLAPGIVPTPDDPAAIDAGLICKLQARQLDDAQRELGDDIGRIAGTLSAILSDVVGVVDQGRSLYGGQSGDSSSFLTRIRQILMQASTLIATCESAGKTVDDALTVVADTLLKFRDAITVLSEAVVDITLIGMNAGLKAGHLGNKGNAFVVIANELKTSADQVSGAAGRLRPVLDAIEKLAHDLGALRRHGDPAQMGELESSILAALREVEAGNGRLADLIGRLIAEGAEFESLMGSAQDLLGEVGKGAATLPRFVARLDAAVAATSRDRPAASDEAAFDALFARYTMERERDVHREFLHGLGLASKAAAPSDSNTDADDGVLLF